MRREYEHRFHFIQEELENLQKYAPIEWHQPNGGLAYWVNFKRNSKTLADEALKKGVLFSHEKSMDFHHREGTHLNIGFASANEQEIAQGFQVLESILKRR